MNDTFLFLVLQLEIPKKQNTNTHSKVFWSDMRFFWSRIRWNSVDEHRCRLHFLSGTVPVQDLGVGCRAVLSDNERSVTVYTTWINETEQERSLHSMRLIKPLNYSTCLQLLPVLSSAELSALVYPHRAGSFNTLMLPIFQYIPSLPSFYTLPLRSQPYSIMQIHHTALSF